MYLVFDILWRLSSSDLITFVLPNTLFGVCTSISSILCHNAGISGAVTHPLDYLIPFFKAALWNWLNLLLFNLSNQRLPEAIAEDKTNKPYRPLASGLLSPDSARRALLYGIPSVVLISSFFLGAYQESVIMVMLTWIYNDLRGGDENFVLRNLIIAISFGVYNHASTRIAGNFAPTFNIAGLNASGSIAPSATDLTHEGQQWIVLISLVIFTTMQIQDFQDVEGDRKRGRKTMMLTLGIQASRWYTALCILGWIVLIPLQLNMRINAVTCILSTILGLYVAYRVLVLTSQKADNISWKIWALWLISLYAMPLAA